MAYWWEGQKTERYWVEIRREPGIGIELWAPTLDEAGYENPWYELVRSVRAGEIIYHYNARESRFVGRSVAAADAVTDSGAYVVELRDYKPIVAPVDLDLLRAEAAAIYDLRDRLVAAHGAPLYLPFQFTRDRSQLRMMSNYFTRMPHELVTHLFGADGLASHRLRELPPDPGEEPPNAGNGGVQPGPSRGGFLNPFQAKADTEYIVQVLGGRKRRTRRHEKLVNDCAAWLSKRKLVPGRNAAVDLGTQVPPVIIEAKIVGDSWPVAVRQAVGQLYEYRYFKVADPAAGLVFLASKPIPKEWVRYLEKDRDIGVMWPDRGGFHLSRSARKSLRL